MYIGVIVGVIKRGLSRCLIVMVSLGWGVVRDRLDQMKAIVVLGLLYVGTAAFRDIMTIVAVTENETLSIKQEAELFDAVTIVTFVVAAIDVTFYMWILDALNGTMQYLENMNQRIKLMRYLQLRSILLFSILFAVLWSVFTLVNTYSDTAILKEQNVWAAGALMELNYLAVLVGVAYLWRPNASAKDLAYVMELPALGGDDDDNELEMTSNIPSALDDDDEVEFQDEPRKGTSTGADLVV
ncbi:Lung seven transmembrane receptor [Fragilaria crotonensis]|nr:Lung seven transmembrane receptor [Fragilaria crotonensis]